MNSWDAIISGGGIVGVSLALELRERGAKVLVLERGQPGNEASSAAAGMLAPADPETPLPLRQIAFASERMFPAYVQKLEASSGLTVDFRHQGTIALLESPTAPAEHEPLTFEKMRDLEPALDTSGLSAFFVQENSVDPNLLMEAALTTARNNGIEIRMHAAVREFRATRDGVEVLTPTDCFSARSAVNCQGAWSGTPVRPRKGQLLYLEPERSGLLQQVVRAPGIYAMPRSSGEILVGATVENVGFEKTVEPGTIRRLIKAVATYLPELASSRLIESWAGLRPGTPDGLPLIGLTKKPGVFIASGHFRNGILLAPITAKIMADLLTDRPLTVDIAAFAPSRFAAAGAK